MKFSQAPVSISAKAELEILNIIKNKSIPQDYYLRIAMKGGGCAGVGYALGFDKKKDNDDEYTLGEVKVLIEKKHTMYLIGLMVDFEETNESRGFTFVPQEKA